MTFQDELDYWCQMGVARQSNLARQLGVARAYINNIVCKNVSLSNDQKERIKRAMKRLESKESRIKGSVKNNLLKCAAMTGHYDKSVASLAKEKVVFWSEIYGGFKE